MSGDACLTSDWQMTGFEDGSRSSVPGVLRNIVRRVQSGGTKGCRNCVCRPAEGFDLGARGGHYYGGCSVDFEVEFLEAYCVLHRLEFDV